MTRSDKIILELIRKALNKDSREEEPLFEKAPWEEVLDVATNQGVLGVCFDAFEHLPEEYRPDLDNLMEWLGQVNYLESHYEQYVETIQELTSFLVKLNLKVLLMKGYGCSLNYPIPKHRPCGDIDIYILNEMGEHNADIVKFAEKQLKSNLVIKVTSETSHHSQFEFEDFTVENHSTVLDVDVHKSSIYMDQLLKKEAKECVSNVDSVTGVCLPTARFNSIHLLRHMASDFATVKTSLRHVLDWSTFISKKDVDWKFVREVAHNANMNKFLDAINGICVEYFGYPSKMFPIEETDVKLRNRVLEDILHPEFTEEIPPMASKLAYGWVKTKRMWRNRWKHRIVYDESLLDSFISHAKNRLKLTKI